MDSEITLKLSAFLQLAKRIEELEKQLLEKPVNKPVDVVNHQYLANKRRFTADQIREIRKSVDTNNMIAKKYDVSEVTISCIKNRKTYKEVN